MTAEGLSLQVLEGTGLRGQKAPAALASRPRTEGGTPHSSSSGQLSSVVPALQPLQLTHEPHIQPWHVSCAADIGNVQAVDSVADLLAAMQPAHNAHGSSADSAASEVTTALQTSNSHHGQAGVFGCATPATAASATADTAVGGAAADAFEHAGEYQDAAHVLPAVQSPPHADWTPDDASSPRQQADTAAEDGPKANDIMRDHTEQQLIHAPEAGSEQPQPSWAADATALQPSTLALEAEGADANASSEVPAAGQDQPPEQHQQRESCVGTITTGALDHDVQHENQLAGFPPTSGSFAGTDGHQSGTTPTAAASAPPLTAMTWAAGMLAPGAARMPGPADPAAADAEQLYGQTAARLAEPLNHGAAVAEIQQPGGPAHEQPAEAHNSPGPQPAGAPVPRAPQGPDSGAHSWRPQPAVQSSGPDAGTERQQEAKDAQHATAAGSIAMNSDPSSLSAPQQQLVLGASDEAAEQTAQPRSWLERSDQEHEHADQLQQRAGLTSDSRFEPQPAAVQLDAQRQSGSLSPVAQQQQVEGYSALQQSDADAQHTSQLPMHAQSLTSPHAEPPAVPVQPSDSAALAPHADWAVHDAASAGRASSAGSACSSDTGSSVGSSGSSRPDASDAEAAQVRTRQDGPWDLCVAVTVGMHLCLDTSICVPLQLPSLEWLLLDAASCSGATSAPPTSRDGEQAAAAAAPAVDPEPAAGDWPTAAQVPHGTTAAEAAEAPTEEAAEKSAADAELQDATAVTAQAAHAGIAGDGFATLLQNTSGRYADSPPVSTTHE